MLIIKPITTKELIILYTIISVFFSLILRSKKLDYKKAKASFFIFINLVISLFIFYFFQNIVNINHLFVGTFITFGLINLIILKLFNFLKQIHINSFVLLTAFLIYFNYISITPYFIRQHDGRSFCNPEFGGHFGYIGYIFENGHLPIGSPKDFWCFFNPPFFYLISAGFIKIQNNFGVEIENCLENLQVLSLIYTLIFDIYLYRILIQLKIDKSLPIILCFVVLSPALIIISGSLNNDILSISLSCMALFYSIKWFNTETLLDLIKIAFCISLAMMTKISSALIAIVIAAIFLVKITKKIIWIMKNNTLHLTYYIKKCLIHFSIFAIIALPIGLWFPIKNWILYDIPPTYIQAVDLDNPSNISKFSVFDRFFKIKDLNLDNINVEMSGKNIDYNIFFTTLKSFIVDENIDYENSSFLRFYNTYYILFSYININYIFHKYIIFTY